MPAFYEFFAGGGMARAGLGSHWDCLFANEIDPKKGASYAANWGGERLRVEDVARLHPSEIPGKADLAWASFPCQDLSLAGQQAGLDGERSGTFWPFWRLMKALTENRRAPHVIVLENVCGALTSHQGADFAAIGTALADSRYRFGALVMDAALFVPQSRPRLFIVGVLGGAAGQSEPDALWHPPNLRAAHKKLPARCKDAWIWWRLPPPPARTATFADVIDGHGEWRPASETQRLMALMNERHRQKVEEARRTPRRMVGGVYRRTRRDAEGRRVQRAEVRFDEIAGCLRTPAGGSSRQVVLVVDRGEVRSRLLSAREAARLMGLPDNYKLPDNYNEAYHLTGDGVVVPVVRHLAAHIIEPLVSER